MSTAELDRSRLDGKDREELHAIASAMGVKAATRMRKAELVDAILAAVEDGNGAPAGDDDAPQRRTVRSARASELADDDVEALAAEQNALDGDQDGSDVEIAPRPNRARTASTTEASAGDDSSGTVSGGSERDRGSSEGDRGTSTATVEVDPEDERASYGEGNTGRRRRRRRGRGQGEGGEPRPSNEPVGDPVEVQGLLELRDEGYGFLRTSGYLAGNKDVYVSASQVRRFALRKGDFVQGFSRPQASNEKYPALLNVDAINAQTPDDARTRPRF